MFPKLLAVVLTLIIAGGGLLAARHRRLEAMHAIARSQDDIDRHEAIVRTLRSEIADRVAELSIPAPPPEPEIEPAAGTEGTPDGPEVPPAAPADAAPADRDVADAGPAVDVAPRRSLADPRRLAAHASGPPAAGARP